MPRLLIVNCTHDSLLQSLMALGSRPYDAQFIVGSLFASRASDSVLRPILAITLLVVSVRLLTA